MPDKPNTSISKAHIDYENSQKKLETPVQHIPGIGPKLSELLNNKGIKTVSDLLHVLPYRYEMRKKVKGIAKLMVGDIALFSAKIIDFSVVRYGRRSIFEVVCADDTGSITLKWFKYSSYLIDRFKRGEHLTISGKVTKYGLAKELHHPDIKKMTTPPPDTPDKSDDEDDHGTIRPVYSEIEGVSQHMLRKIIAGAVEKFLPFYVSPLDLTLFKDRNSMTLSAALRNLHMPAKDDDITLLNSFKSKAHKRLIFDEFFYFEMLLALKKKGRTLKRGIPFDHADECISALKKLIPFKLTDAQERVVLEIAGDMSSNRPMNRLLQGDVGSGKTIVALFAIYIATRNSYQAAIMAPTEILATQHHKNLSALLDKLGISSALLTGTLKKREREDILKRIKSGDLQVIIGTHAVIQEGVEMHDLGLAIIDEQHRFGVAQRTSLMKKRKNRAVGSEPDYPDILIMTATPIPRTLAITVYGDLDVSVIDEMPPGRKPVKTLVFYEKQREKVYGIIEDELKAGNQAYIVYPLVSESEKLDLKDATNMYEHLSRDVFPDYRLGLLHGRIKGKEKDEIMRKFREKELDMLVATTVIEVGIDIPTASIIVVEHAERFGLSQLHQLRGRVGRSDVPAKCVLLAKYARSEESKIRLKVMERTTDGFEIAQEDMKIRGPGEMLGTRQSGLPDFQIASLIRDLPILTTARKMAFILIHEDHKLENGDNRLIKREFNKRMKGKLELASIG